MQYFKYFTAFYGNRNIKIHLRHEGCFYCGEDIDYFSDESCSCNIDNEIQRIHDLSFDDYHELIDNFYQWAETTDEILLNECDDISKNNNSEVLKANYLLPLIVIIDTLHNDYRYNKFTQWIDSDSQRQRLISYMFILLSTYKHPYLDSVFERITTDLEVYDIIQRIYESIQFYPYTSSINRRVSNEAIQRVLNEIVKIHEKLGTKSFRINTKIIIEMIGRSSEKISLDALVILINQNYVTKQLKYHIRDIQKDEIDPTKPIEYYNELILFCFRRKLDNIIYSFYSHYMDRLSNLANQYLIDNLNSIFEFDGSSDEFEFSYIHSTCIGIILWKELLNLTCTTIDRFLCDIILNHSELSWGIKNQLFTKFNDITPYFQTLMVYVASQDAMAQYYYLLFIGLPRESMQQKHKIREMFESNILKYNKSLNSHSMLFKFFDRSDPTELAVIRKHLSKMKLKDSEFSFDCYSDYTLSQSLEMVIEFSQSVQMVGDLTVKTLNSINSLVVGSLNKIFATIKAIQVSGTRQLVLDKIESLSTEIVNVYSMNTDSRNYIINCVFDFKDSARILLKMVPDSVDMFWNMFIQAIDDKEELYSNSVSNLLLLMNQYKPEQVENHCIDRFDKFHSYDMIVYIIRDFSKYGDKGYQIIAKNYKDLSLLEKLFKIYDQGSEHILKYCELSLYLLFSKCTEPMEIIKKYYHNITDSIYRNEITIRNNEEFISNLDQVIRGRGFEKSKLFKQFYFELPQNIVNQVSYCREKRQLQIEKYNNSQLSISSSSGSIISNSNGKSLSKIIITRIIHHFLYDRTIESPEKIELALVCKQWFDITAKILLDYYDEDSLVNYIDLISLYKLNIDNEYSLMRDYPKVMSMNQVNLINNPQIIERLIYNRVESLSISVNYFGMRLNRNTKIKHLEMTIDRCLPESYISIFKHCPHLKSLELIFIKQDWRIVLESILSLDTLPNLELIKINLNSNINNCTLAPLISKFQNPTLPTNNNINNTSNNQNVINSTRKLPKFQLLATPCFDYFDGFSMVTITMADDELDLKSMLKFYQTPLSYAKDEISFVLSDHSHVIPLIEFTNQFQTMKMSLSLGLPKSLSIDLVQSIFDKLNETTNIGSFEIYFKTWYTSLKVSILSDNEWQFVNLRKFKYPNSISTTFYQSIL
ncbi:hypothetical protein DLAC_02108 [Tieghemostelium lacteum]|uniref:Uncharacterized protein n=1 Tax=Tieghemostelium lacteum TaxID=361077 RepID=A0A152A4L9_TIELA|nr:hypothetical protein DLAC_02108 [Tieghemostelium lacteum]|eukprot:KYR01025.1 hypothetical protein DLAC_02108 [Tieghemostelium lacteum]